jgi:hypothetical protein
MGHRVLLSYDKLPVELRCTKHVSKMPKWNYRDVR